MIWLILYGVSTLLCWIFTAFTLRGVDWILISGVNMLPKEDKQKYKEKHNMVEMNRYIAKKTLLPVSIWLLIFAPFMFSQFFFNAEWIETTWYGVGYIIIVIISAIIMSISIFSAMPKILGNTFEKK